LELELVAQGDSEVRAARAIGACARRVARWAALPYGFALRRLTHAVLPRASLAPPAAAAQPEESVLGDGAAAAFAVRALAALFAVTLAAAPAGALAYAARVPVGGAGGGAAPSHTLLHALSYRLDQFFSTNAFSKPLLLLSLTALMVVAGSAALFAASPGAEAGTVFWAALAGVGLDWTFAGEEGTTLAHRSCALLLAVGGRPRVAASPPHLAPWPPPPGPARLERPAGVATLLAAGGQGFVYNYSQCADPAAEACSARGAPDREALLRAGARWRGAPRCRGGPGSWSAGRG
jgi:hypothetical protein